MVVTGAHGVRLNDKLGHTDFTSVVECVYELDAIHHKTISEYI
jgi:hypothetical protein